MLIQYLVSNIINKFIYFNKLTYNKNKRFLSHKKIELNRLMFYIVILSHNKLSREKLDINWRTLIILLEENFFSSIS